MHAGPAVLFESFTADNHMESLLKCFHDRADVCRHAKLPRLETTAERCRTCPHYDGPARGLGDVVHRVAEVTGVARVVKAVGGDCGCQKRREALNQTFPKGP